MRIAAEWRCKTSLWWGVLSASGWEGLWRCEALVMQWYRCPGADCWTPVLWNWVLSKVMLILQDFFFLISLHLAHPTFKTTCLSMLSVGGGLWGFCYFLALALACLLAVLFGLRSSPVSLGRLVCSSQRRRSALHGSPRHMQQVQHWSWKALPHPCDEPPLRCGEAQLCTLGVS